MEELETYKSNQELVKTAWLDEVDARKLLAGSPLAIHIENLISFNPLQPCGKRYYPFLQMRIKPQRD